MTRCTAFPKRSAKGAFAWRRPLALHVPEYSVLRPETVARQRPVHPAAATLDAGSIVTDGWYEETFDFDPGMTADAHSPLGKWDVFVTRLLTPQ